MNDLLKDDDDDCDVDENKEGVRVLSVLRLLAEVPGTASCTASGTIAPESFLGSPNPNQPDFSFLSLTFWISFVFDVEGIAKLRMLWCPLTFERP